MGCRDCALRDALEAYRSPDGTVVKVVREQYPESPREYDDLSRLVSLDGRFSGDDVDEELYRACMTPASVKRFRKAGGLLEPVHCYEHGGIALSLGGVPASWPDQQWDVRFVGFMAAPAEAIRRVFCRKRIAKSTRELALRHMRESLKQYEDYLNGAVYRYVAYDHAWNERDSCGGYLGADHAASGLFEAAGLPAKPVPVTLKHERMAHAC